MMCFTVCQLAFCAIDVAFAVAVVNIVVVAVVVAVVSVSVNLSNDRSNISKRFLSCHPPSSHFSSSGCLYT